MSSLGAEAGPVLTGRATVSGGWSGGRPDRHRGELVPFRRQPKPAEATTSRPQQPTEALRAAPCLKGLAAHPDEALVELARAGDEGAVDQLLTRFRYLAENHGRSYFMPGAEREDLVQEGMIGLLKAVRDFRAGRGCSFRGFAEMCVRRQVITAIKTATRQKHAALNHYRSLDQPLSGEGGDDRTLAERLPGSPSADNHLFDGNEAYRALLECAPDYLSTHELTVLRLYCEGLNYAEIASRIGRTIKSVDNAVFKCKLKLRRRAQAAVEDPTQDHHADRRPSRKAPR